MFDNLSNPMLVKIERQIESTLTPQTQENYQKIVTAGLKIVMRGGKDSQLAKLANMPDPVNACAVGAVNLVVTMRRMSRGTMPGNAMVPAAMTLMLEGLDFAEKVGVIQIDEKVMERATKIFTDMVFRVFKISQGTLNKAADAVHRVIEDPRSGEVLRQKAATMPQLNQQIAAASQSTGGGGLISPDTSGQDESQQGGQ